MHPGEAVIVHDDRTICEGCTIEMARLFAERRKQQGKRVADQVAAMTRKAGL